jgi:hypothetical protein
MPWDRSQPTDPKYRTREHRILSAEYKRQIRAGQALPCTARTCLFGRAPITNPNGRQDDGVTVGHADNGVDIDGPQHRLCNVTDGAVRARARQTAGPRRWIF